MTISKHTYRLFNDIFTEVWVEIGEFIMDREAGEYSQQQGVYPHWIWRKCMGYHQIQKRTGGRKEQLKRAVVREGHSEYPNLNQVGTLGDKWSVSSLFLPLLSRNFPLTNSKWNSEVKEPEWNTTEKSACQSTEQGKQGCRMDLGTEKKKWTEGHTCV